RSRPAARRPVRRSRTRTGSARSLQRQGPQPGVRSGEDLGFLAVEFLGRDDAPVTQVGELGQLIRRTLRARSLLDVLAELPLLDFRVPHLVLVHLAAA